MKKIFLILSIFALQLQASAFEDYIIMSDFPIKAAYSKDENIASVTTFYTIDNKKNTLVLKAKREGQTQLVIETEKSILSADVVVRENETKISPLDGVSFFVLDVAETPDKPKLREGK